ncbi:MAG: HAD family hydrolase [Bacteroidota bacterium]
MSPPLPTFAVLLDWDGTLIESLPLKIENAGRLFEARYGASAADVRASYAKHSGIPRRQLFDRIAEDTIGRTLTDDEFPSMSEAFSAGNRAIVIEKGHLRGGTLAGLKALREAGCALFVSTSAAQDEMEPLAHHFGIAALCDGLFGSRPGFSKGPEHAAHVRSMVGEDLPMAHIGDDESDMHLARAAGIAGIGITGTRTRDELTRAGAVAVVDALPDVVDLLPRMKAPR